MSATMTRTLTALLLAIGSGFARADDPFKQSGFWASHKGPAIEIQQMSWGKKSKIVSCNGTKCTVLKTGKHATAAAAAKAWGKTLGRKLTGPEGGRHKTLEAYAVAK